MPAELLSENINIKTFLEPLVYEIIQIVNISQKIDTEMRIDDFKLNIKILSVTYCDVIK